MLFVSSRSVYLYVLMKYVLGTVRTDIHQEGQGGAACCALHEATPVACADRRFGRTPRGPAPRPTAYNSCKVYCGPGRNERARRKAQGEADKGAVRTSAC